MRVGLKSSMFLGGALSALMFCGASAAFAQDLPAPEVTQSDDTTTESDEIVVRAQRREERSVDVPISVVSRSAEQLEDANIGGTISLGQVVPGLVMSRLAGNVAPSIRGVTSKVVSPGQDPNVATYVDGFYQANPVALNRTLLDVSSIEVLRGPQGTLFGRNSTGGAILITTRRPSFDPELVVSVAAEEFNGRDVVAYGSMGLTNNLAVSLQGAWAESDQWLYNNVPGLEFPTAPKEQEFLRGRLLFEPTPDLTLDFALEQGMMQDGVAAAFSHFAHPNNPAFPILHDDPRETSVSIPSRARDEWTAGYLTIGYDFGWATLRSYSQYRDDETTWNWDLDGSPTANIILLDSTLVQRTITQEFNLTSAPGGPLSWIVGYFYLDDVTDWRNRAAGLGRSAAQTETWSVYGDATWQVSDRLYLTAGARFHNQDQHCSASAVASSTGPLQDCFLGGGSADYSEDATTARFVARYEIADNTNIYASFSQGFKSGGFNVPVTTPTIEPENLDALEVGFKTRGETFSFDAAAYHYDYQNLQVSYTCTVAAPPVCLAAGTSVVTNAAAATIYGGEVQIMWRPIERLRLDGGLAYVHGRYDEFQNAPAAAPTACANPDPNLCPNVSVAQDWAGQQVIRAPEWSGNLSATYEIPTSFGLLEVAGNVAYVDDFTSDTAALPCTTLNCNTGSPRLVIPSHTLVGATLSWTAPGENWQVALYARNLLDEDYIIRTDGNTIGDYRIAGEPQVIGARLRYSY